MSDHGPNATSHEELVRRIVTDQAVAEAKAVAIAEKLRHGDDDIYNAALVWGRTGQLPGTPVVEGYSPALLGQRMSVTMALTALLGLRRDPARTLSALRHHARPRG